MTFSGMDGNFEGIGALGKLTGATSEDMNGTNVQIGSVNNDLFGISSGSWATAFHGGDQARHADGQVVTNSLGELGDIITNVANTYSAANDQGGAAMGGGGSYWA